MPDSRYAIYFTPEHGSPLERFGAAILGYDCYEAQPVPHAAFADVEPDSLREITAEPRRYGFHATLKPPFRLAPGCTEADLLEAVRDLAATLPPVPIGLVGVAALGGFIAVIPVAGSTELMLLAAECVASLDGFRAPLTEHDIARREVSRLNARQAALLRRWGYPYVFDQFRFHMTLTGSLDPERQGAWLARLADAFAPLASAPVVIDALAILRQDGPEARFAVVERTRLEGRRE
jgi:putative phosphonate metabolism protein